jgi:hypothetical protein
MQDTVQEKTQETKSEKQQSRGKAHCFWGVHKFETIDTQNILNNRSDEIGRIYIQQCSECGKIRATHVKFYDF